MASTLSIRPTEQKHVIRLHVERRRRKNWPDGLGKEKVVKADEFVRLGCIFIFLWLILE
jgi:hypothetical protein